MLHAHNALRPIDTLPPILRKCTLIDQIRNSDIDGRGGLALEAKLAAPGHVLDGHEGAVSDDDHVKVAVGDEDALRGVDDLWEDGLDRVCGEVAFAFWAAGMIVPLLFAADEDRVGGAFGP